MTAVHAGEGISLTRRQRDLLTFIDGYLVRHGYGPSCDEMRAGIGLTGKGRIAALLNALEERGRIRRIRNRARAIEVVRPAPVIIRGEPYRFIRMGC